MLTNWQKARAHPRPHPNPDLVSGQLEIVPKETGTPVLINPG